jgi:16S rRNA (guanine527-N7)-methyltransferase
MGEGAEALLALADVSHETVGKLEVFAALLRKWQRAENLVAPSTLGEIWSRHIADSAQLAVLFPGLRWVDLGSGGGFPGLVVAIINARHVHLIESNRRKCAFLRAAIHETGASATVHEGRIEAVLASWKEPVDRISARALASLADLLQLAEPLLGRGIPAAFLKGAEYQREIADADRDWSLDIEVIPSRVGAGGAILDVHSARRRANQDKTQA